MPCAALHPRGEKGGAGVIYLFVLQQSSNPTGFNFIIRMDVFHIRYTMMVIREDL